MDWQNETPDLRWFEDQDHKCSRCGKPSQGILRGVANESYGRHCRKCAEKRLSDSKKRRESETESREAYNLRVHGLREEDLP